MHLASWIAFEGVAGSSVTKKHRAAFLSKALVSLLSTGLTKEMSGDDKDIIDYQLKIKVDMWIL